ncbi:MAG: hypothetical protein A3B89_04215 [Candidatus Buchananbacteria bacterium RIFCSPHIGHO2_02_FULL_40_13]|uniref:PEGA domain-containing protein n=1 Tax=Candidatus Buchananbacteria bacterium RIFCSPLOWO2_01_FULL_39_33 TaxID=1797543 RepID=A0A1G1YKW3_9BACT|nr:MAG: hypothetical protein A2820_01920 [Candidatus Buchananbacteria bacterium RIFCSPHIGHO2_01_FULL_40_35]OGY50882.1 MAG: hypothetical protein A3B89_04215 [Candidatus Buchananbacteria bacterium RIFCSPHIGHO2_02_FULL_40_13]OGY52949.1 MAG: hypothetical protein A3A02_04390 [Candidatus Buchananbacteria bacterium RIFCSPLOWO2_01_FULL_39_33]
MRWFGKIKIKKENDKYKNIKLTTANDLALRRTIYILFIVIFLIAAPLVVLYSEGYRYNLKRGKIQKTGILIISSLPKKADIYLNGKVVIGDQTPARLEKLLPADYEIKIAKEGYYDWTKKLQIFENSTTFAEEVILWKNNWPTQLASYDIIDWLASPDNQKSVFLTQNRKIMALDFTDKKISELHQAGYDDNLKILSWSNTSKKILIQVGSQYLVINTERPADSPLVIPNNDYFLIKWDLKNDNLVYALNNLGVYKIDLFSQKTNLILNKKVTDFLVNNDLIYFYYKDVIYKQKITDISQLEIIDGLKCSNCRFINRDFARLLLLDQSDQELFIIDPSTKNKTIKQAAKNVNWLKDDTFLFYNDWEIWIYELEKKEPEIITRIGAGVSQVLWQPEGRHIIFISDNKIKIIELDNRELRNIIELFNGHKINYLTLDNRGRDLYFQSIIADKPYLMELTIR